MSSLEVCPVRLDDVRATTLLTFAGFADNVITKIFYPKGVTPDIINHFVEQDTKGWGKDPRVRHMQVKDTRTGEIVSYSQWFIYPERSRAELSKAVKLQWPDGCNQETNNALLNTGRRKRNGIMGGNPHICTSFQAVQNREPLYIQFTFHCDTSVIIFEASFASYSL